MRTPDVLRCDNCHREQPLEGAGSITVDEANRRGWGQVMKVYPDKLPNPATARIVCPFCNPCRATS